MNKGLEEAMKFAYHLQTWHLNGEEYTETWIGDADDFDPEAKLPTHPLVKLTQMQTGEAILEDQRELERSDEDYASNLYDEQLAGDDDEDEEVPDMIVIRRVIPMPRPSGSINRGASMLAGIISEILDFAKSGKSDQDGLKCTTSLRAANRLLELVENLEKLFADKANIPAKRKKAISSNAAEIEKVRAEYEGLLNIELGGITLEKYKEVVCETRKCPTILILDKAEAKMKVLFPEG